MMYVEFMKNFPLADWSKLMAVRFISAYWAEKRWFLLSIPDVRGVHEKFFSLRDLSEIMAVRLISATWAQKRLIPTF